jgi:hypothetical protein
MSLPNPLYQLAEQHAADLKQRRVEAGLRAAQQRGGIHKLTELAASAGDSDLTRLVLALRDLQDAHQVPRR